MRYNMFAKPMKVKFLPNDKKESSRPGIRMDSVYEAYDVVDERILVIDDNNEFVWADLHKFKVVKDDRTNQRIPDQAGDEGLQQGTKPVSIAGGKATNTGTDGTVVRTKAKPAQSVGNTMDFAQALS